MKVKNLSVFLFASVSSKQERASGLLQKFTQSCDGFDPASASRSEDFLEKKKKKQRLNLMGEKIVGGTQVPTGNFLKHKILFYDFGFFIKIKKIIRGHGWRRSREDALDMTGLIVMEILSRFFTFICL